MTGKGYLYKAEGDTYIGKWTYVQEDLITDDLTIKYMDQVPKASPIGWTLNEVYLNPSKYQYILYNNEIPSGVQAQTLSPKDKSSKFGSGKGALIWDKEGGSAIFIVHSAGNFLPPISEKLRQSKLFSQQNYDSNGHSFLCVMLPPNYVGTIIGHLIMIKALVYDKFLTTDDSWKKLRSAQIKIYGKSNVNTPDTVSRDSRTNVHSSNQVIPSKSNGGKSKIIKEKIGPNSDSLIVTLKSTNFRIISKSFKEPGGIWKKIMKEDGLYLIKPHTILSSSRPCSKIKGIRIYLSQAENLRQPIHWNYHEDKFNFGFYYFKGQKFRYCHSDIEDRNRRFLLGRSKAGLALCLQGNGVEDLTEILQKTTVKSCLI